MYLIVSSHGRQSIAAANGTPAFQKTDLLAKCLSSYDMTCADRIKTRYANVRVHRCFAKARQTFYPICGTLPRRLSTLTTRIVRKIAPKICAFIIHYFAVSSDVHYVFRQRCGCVSNSENARLARQVKWRLARP